MVEISDEEVVLVREVPLTVMLKLPDGCTPGRWESAEAFAEAYAQLHSRHPNKKFQLLPFSYKTPSNGTDPALDAILAIADR